MRETALVARISGHVPARAALVRRVARLHLQAKRAGRLALTRAREIGDLLKGLHPGERVAIAEAAGFSLRTCQLYCRIARRWAELETQRVASVRGAQSALASKEKAKLVAATYRVRNAHASPDDLRQVLASVKGESVHVVVKVMRTQVVEEDPHEPRFPGFEWE